MREPSIHLGMQTSSVGRDSAGRGLLEKFRRNNTYRYPILASEDTAHTPLAVPAGTVVVAKGSKVSYGAAAARGGDSC